jgi:hypothetical protein
MATGLAILCDTSTSPVFPRWSGYLGLLMGWIQVAASLLVYFKTGPFAWNGLVSWYIPLTDFFLWFVIMTVLTTKAINADHRDLAESPQRTESLLADAPAVEGGHVLQLIAGVYDGPVPTSAPEIARLARWNWCRCSSTAPRSFRIAELSLGVRSSLR